MSEAKFTKGPWGWEYDESTSSIIQVFSEAEEAKGDPDICRMQHEPDACLIAVAPKMYKKLDEICEGLFEAGGVGNVTLAREIENLLMPAPLE